ncbi:MAG: BTAD domain-containing putative transcriptional regulator, partial [Actinomycetota bacterium]|nr:BTAD domain-containing putative transcriptional regulator [Actinomycetota bacterium]
MGRAARHVMIDVLGPLRVRDEAGRDLTPSGQLQRRLLAVLVLRRGRVVSVDAAVEALWPATLPDDPAAALQNHVSRLRRSLPDGAIESLADGYRLDPSQVDVDVDRLASALGLGETADGDALAEIEAVLARWKGPAYPELDELDEAAAEAARLEELRTRAVELRAAVRLARGDTDGLAAELVTLTDAEPLRERPRALLMATLAATGRHAEALRVYDDFRRVLGDELGTTPSPALTAQHAALLAGTWEPEWAAASRLPVPATSLHGRDELAAEVAEATRAARLVTLVGPGGVGKTRLLIEVGRRLRAEHPSLPVVLCELATADAAAAVDVVAAALDIDRRPGSLLVDRIVDVVGDTELMLLFDNCEHVLDEAAEMAARLLATCPQVRVVATSRERLRVQGEHVRQVPTLPCDDDSAAALQLFVERARAARPGFQPDDTELAGIAEIVRRLDGLPLAIELAAARLHTHELDEIEAGLVDRFRLLSSGYRTSSRHGSLSAAVEWSFGLLEPHLQETFANLSAFT